MRACLLYNPCAEFADQIALFIRELSGDHRCELRPTKCSGDATTIAREAVASGVERIIVAGGDGMINQTIHGMAPNFDACELALLPFGTGNDLARSLGLSPDRLEVACQIALGDRVEAIDVLRLSNDKTSYCINVANGGFGGRIAIDVQSEDKRRWGPLAYWLSSVSHLADLEEYELSLSLDGKPLELSTIGIAIANGRYVGGGFPIAPEALLHDGLMEVVTVPVLPTLELMSAGLGVTLGQQHESVKTYHVRHLKLDSHPAMPFSIDGEPAEEFHAEIEVLPRVLRVAVGDPAPGLTPAEKE